MMRVYNNQRILSIHKGGQLKAHFVIPSVTLILYQLLSNTYVPTYKKLCN